MLVATATPVEWLDTFHWFVAPGEPRFKSTLALVSSCLVSTLRQNTSYLVTSGPPVHWYSTSHWLLWLALVTPTPVHQFGWHGMFMSTTFHSSGKWLEDMRVVGIAKPVAPSGVSVRAPCSMALFPTELCILYHQTLQSEYTPKVMWGN